MLVNALIDAPTATLLTLNTNLPTIAFLLRAIPDSEHVINVTVPNYPKGLDIKPSTYLDHVWDRYRRLFAAGQPAPTRVRKAALLAAKKAEAFGEVARTLAYMRSMVMSAVPLQDAVYTSKRLEAERFLREGTSADPLEYPYIMQFADLSGLAPQQAAEEILLKARLTDDLLLKSEYFRLKYLELLRETSSIGAVDFILIGFRREFFGEKKAENNV
jgi:hypothetical protein